MPTRRQLLGGSAFGVGARLALGAGAVGATAVLAGCDTRPPVPPKGHAYLYRTSNGYRRDLMVCDAAGRNAKDTVASVYGRAAFTPDGNHIAVARGTGEDSRGTYALWVVRTNGSLLHQITFPAVGVADLDPAFAPDGKTIVFNRDTIGFGYGAGLWLVQADGSRLRFVPGGAGGITPQFNNNGGAIVYAAFDGIRRISPQGDSARLIVRNAFGWQCTQPTWSPNGKLVAFVRKDTGGGTSLCTVPAPGGAVTTQQWIANVIETPAWSRDSTSLTYVAVAGIGAEGRTSATVFHKRLDGIARQAFQAAGPPLTDLATWAG
jgi:Tol biopolymer transport system component